MSCPGSRWVVLHRLLGTRGECEPMKPWRGRGGLLSRAGGLRRGGPWGVSGDGLHTVVPGLPEGGVLDGSSALLGRSVQAAGCRALGEAAGRLSLQRN